MRSLFMTAAVLTLAAAGAHAERYSNQIAFSTPLCRTCEYADKNVQLAAWNTVLGLKEVGATVYGVPAETNISFSIDFTRPSDGNMDFTVPHHSRQTYVSAIGAQEALNKSISEFYADCRQDGWQMKCAVMEKNLYRVGGGYEYVWFGVIWNKPAPKMTIESMKKDLQTSLEGK